MQKLKMHTPNLTTQNLEKIKALFPNCITESLDDNGALKLAIDFDLLKQELSEQIIDGPQERYQLNWPGKREALLTANTPINKTLRPAFDESVDFENTKNLFIEGDNLEALKLLQETYLGKVKMIYIDPPYNTGKDFIYRDNFTQNTTDYLLESNQKDEEGNRFIANTESNGRFHSDWLSFIYPRLKLARNLLADDGVIFISIDDNEQANLKKLCDEVFGEENFVASFIWEKNFAPKNDNKYISNSHEYILMFAKQKNKFNRILLPRQEKHNKDYKNPDNDPRGNWTSGSILVTTFSQSSVFTIIAPNGKEHNPPSGRSWRYSKDKINELLDDNRLWFGLDGNGVPRVKRFLSEMPNGIVPQSLLKWNDVGSGQEASTIVKHIFNDSQIFDFPKPVSLIKRILQISTSHNDLILDFFAGSSTTAHAVMQLNAEDGGNRQFIMVQLPEKCDEKSESYKAGYKNIAEISKERIRRAGKKILEGDCHEGWNKDIGFRVLKIDDSNFTDVYYEPSKTTQANLLLNVNNIKNNRTEEDLLFQTLLDLGVDLTLPITKKTLHHKTIFLVNADKILGEDRIDLIACFDNGINEDLIKEIAKLQPLKVVFKDNGFVSDAIKINVVQIFKQISPNTEVKAI